MSESDMSKTETRRAVSAASGSDAPPAAGEGRRILVRDLVLACEIGVFRHERGARQRVRINLDLAVREEAAPIADDLRNVVCYDEIVSGIRRLTEAGHVNLVETLAERIAAMCLADARIRRAVVRVEKLDVYPDVASVGIEIDRINRLP
ncbi:MAG TPA: dihydroneopterin aldolase [Stellaceae bacterium]|jgi:dihydroneopterin aldolase|nr:dihydroneopterin aldolase [Stellaceae bacterium]